MRIARILRTIIGQSLAAGALLWCSCTLQTGSEIGSPLVFVASFSFGEAGAAGTAPWWESFGDRRLDDLIETALRQNLDLAGLVARVYQADAELRKASGQLFPMLVADAGYESRWLESDPGPSVSDQSPSLGALLTYEADVWGRLRSLRDSAQAAKNASVADWHAGRLLLSAAVTETYFGIIEQQNQLRLSAEQIETGETLLDLTELRFGQAQSSIVDVLQQREQLAGTTARVPLIKARLRQLELALDTLLSRPPDSGGVPSPRPLKPPPNRLAAGAPSDLLANRPDLVAARERLVGADAEVAAAIADRLPRFTLGARSDASRIGSVDTLVTEAFAGLVGPVIDGGTRKAEVGLKRAELEEALAGYSQAYLTAVRDVETAYAQERQQAERVRLVEEQLAVATRLLAESRNQYAQGLTDYLPVLTAVTTEQALQRGLVTERREWISFRIALHRALGGPVIDRKNRSPAE